MRRVRQTVQDHRARPGTHEGALGRKAVSLQQVQQGVQDQGDNAAVKTNTSLPSSAANTCLSSPECIAGPSEDARRRETLRVSVLHEGIQRERLSRATRPPSHGGEAFQVSQMRPSLCRARDAKPTHARQRSVWSSCLRHCSGSFSE